MIINTPVFHVNDLEVTSPYEGMFYVNTDSDEDVTNVAIYLQKEGFNPQLVAKRKLPPKLDMKKVLAENKKPAEFKFMGITVTPQGNGVFHVDTNSDEDVTNVAIYLGREGFAPKSVEKKPIRKPSKPIDRNDGDFEDGDDWKKIVC